MDLYTKIDNINLLDFEEHFSLFQTISNAVNSNDNDERTVGRHHLIRIIDVWEKVPTELNLRPPGYELGGKDFRLFT